MKVINYLLAILLLTVGMAALAQAAFDPLAPQDWFISPEIVIAAGAYFAAQITRLLTALGKDWLGTDGARTRYLAIAISAIIAGIGGYLSLGYLSDLSGWRGALSAALMVVVSVFGAIAKTEYDRQTLAAGAERVEERAKAKLLRP